MNALSLIGHRFILLTNIAVLRWLVWLADYQQDSLKRLDWPRSPLIDDRKAQFDSELVRLEMQLRGI